MMEKKMCYDGKNMLFKCVMMEIDEIRNDSAHYLKSQEFGYI